MARYGKTNKGLVKLIEKAKNAPSKDGLQSVLVRKDGKPLYQVCLCAGAYEFSAYLHHYDTLILKYDRRRKRIVYYGGYSASDRDALNTFLDEMGHTRNEYFRIQDGELKLEKMEVAV